MKKMIVIALAVLFLFGCGSDEKKNETDQSANSQNAEVEGTDSEFSAAPDVDMDASFKLTYSIPAGEKLKYKLTSVATTNQKIQADSIIENNVSQTIEYIFNLESKGQKENSTILDITIESINISANYNGELLGYDSKQLNDEETNLKFSEYSSLPNKTFQATINQQGRILAVKNIDEIVNAYLKIQKAESITTEEKAQLTTQLSEQALQPLVQQMFRYIPENETKIDSSWDLVYGSPMGLYELTNTARSTLRDVVKKGDDLVAKITTELSVTYKGDGFIQQGDVSYQFEKPKITGNAVTYFDIDRNIVLKSELTTKTEMNVLVTAKNPNAGMENATRADLSVNRNFLELISE